MTALVFLGMRAFRQQPTGLAGPALSDAPVKAPQRPEPKTRPEPERPRLHKVILVNDDYTPRDFVVTVLKAEFRLTDDLAYRVMITAHRKGTCVIAVYPRDVAETKATRASEYGRKFGYPLQFTTEPEE